MKILILAGMIVSLFTRRGRVSLFRQVFLNHHGISDPNFSTKMRLGVVLSLY